MQTTHAHPRNRRFNKSLREKRSFGRKNDTTQLLTLSEIEAISDYVQFIEVGF